MDFDQILKGAHDEISGKTVAQPEPPQIQQTAPAGETESKEAAGIAKPAAADDDEGETPAPDEHGRVPLDALKSERAKRQDWKAKAIQFEEQKKALEEKLAAATPAQPPHAPQRAAKPPSPIEDPEGFTRHMQEQLHQQKLHNSEIMLRQAHPDVDAKLEVFLKAAKANPSLLEQANSQPHPWGWMYAQAGKLAAQAEIGDDPAAFRARIEADIRAKIEAERRDGAPTIDLNAPSGAPAHRPGPSLAAVRASGPAKVSAAGYTGPAPLGAFTGKNAVAARR